MTVLGTIKTIVCGIRRLLIRVPTVVLRPYFYFLAFNFVSCIFTSGWVRAPATVSLPASLGRVFTTSGLPGVQPEARVARLSP